MTERTQVRISAASRTLRGRSYWKAVLLAAPAQINGFLVAIPWAALGQGRYQLCQINITKGPFTLAESLVITSHLGGLRSCPLRTESSPAVCGHLATLLTSRHQRVPDVPSTFCFLQIFITKVRRKTLLSLAMS